MREGFKAINVCFNDFMKTRHTIFFSGRAIKRGGGVVKPTEPLSKKKPFFHQRKNFAKKI